MAPKNKVEEPEKKPLIGRVGTNLRVGIVGEILFLGKYFFRASDDDNWLCLFLGVPNVGKSTFFNVLTKSAAPAENFPFCTIDPNENKYLNFRFNIPNLSKLSIYFNQWFICFSFVVLTSCSSARCTFRLSCWVS